MWFNPHVLVYVKPPHDSGYVAHPQFTVMWLTRTFTGSCGSPHDSDYVAHHTVLICVAPPADLQVVLHVLVYDDTIPGFMWLLHVLICVSPAQFTGYCRGSPTIPGLWLRPHNS
jgi:hypothetical protein